MQTLTPATLTAPHDGAGATVETAGDPTAGHTPGPWVADFPNNLVNSVASGYPDPVCRVGWSGLRGRAEIEANAALIARAPEMAAEIEQLRAENARHRATIDAARFDQEGRR